MNFSTSVSKGIFSSPENVQWIIIHLYPIWSNCKKKQKWEYKKEHTNTIKKNKKADKITWVSVAATITTAKAVTIKL